jgi:hypothetical protein
LPFISGILSTPTSSIENVSAANETDSINHPQRDVTAVEALSEL